MAQFKVENKGMDTLISELSSLQAENLCMEMLNGSVEILQESVVSYARLHVETGEMQASIKPTKAKKAKDGYSVSVRPTGTDSKGVRNMEKLVYLENGTSKQAPTPILQKAVNSCRSQVEARMQEIFERRVDKL